VALVACGWADQVVVAQAPADVTGSGEGVGVEGEAVLHEASDPRVEGGVVVGESVERSVRRDGGRDERFQCAWVADAEAGIEVGLDSVAQRPPRQEAETTTRPRQESATTTSCARSHKARVVALIGSDPGVLGEPGTCSIRLRRQTQDGVRVGRVRGQFDTRTPRSARRCGCRSPNRGPGGGAACARDIRTTFPEDLVDAGPSVVQALPHVGKGGPSWACSRSQPCKRPMS